MPNFWNGGMNMPGPFAAFGNMMNLMSSFNQFRQNPAAALAQMGYNIPQNVQGNPEAMVNYLRNSGQMNDQMYSQFCQMANQFQNIMPRNF